jgi:hypothetical protein
VCPNTLPLKVAPSPLLPLRPTCAQPLRWRLLQLLDNDEEQVRPLPPPPLIFATSRDTCVACRSKTALPPMPTRNARENAR